jgi:hypothetical protein
MTEGFSTVYPHDPGATFTMAVTHSSLFLPHAVLDGWDAVPKETTLAS